MPRVLGDLCSLYQIEGESSTQHLHSHGWNGHLSVQHSLCQDLGRLLLTHMK